MSPPGQILAISGIDGSGKSAIIERLQKELAARGRESRTVWLRYNHYLTKVLLAYCRLAGYTHYEMHSGVRVGYHDFHRSRIVSGLFVLLTFLDTLGATAWKVYRPVLLGRRLVICDRWVFDIIVDLAVDTGWSIQGRPRWVRAFLRLIPAGARCFVLDRDPEALREARQEHRFDRNFPRRLALFQELKSHPRAVAVENRGTIQDAARRIMEAIG